MKLKKLGCIGLALLAFLYAVFLAGCSQSTNPKTTETTVTPEPQPEPDPQPQSDNGDLTSKLADFGLWEGSGTYNKNTYLLTVKDSWNGGGLWLGEYDASAYEGLCLEYKNATSTFIIRIEYPDEQKGEEFVAKAGSGKVYAKLSSTLKNKVQYITIMSNSGAMSVQFVSLKFVTEIPSEQTDPVVEPEPQPEPEPEPEPEPVIETKKYTITYYANGGVLDNSSETSYTQTEDENKKIYLAANKFTKTGAGFAGWARNSWSTNADYTDEEHITLTSNLSLYAIWKNDIEVTFDLNGGSGTINVLDAKWSCDSGKYVLKITKSSITKTGYQLMGWALSNDAETPDFTDYAEFADDGAKTLYAVWAKKSDISVKIIFESVSEKDDISLSYNSATHSIEAKLKDSSVYTKWNWYVDDVYNDSTNSSSFNIYELKPGLHTVTVITGYFTNQKSQSIVVNVKSE